MQIVASIISSALIAIVVALALTLLAGCLAVVCGAFRRPERTAVAQARHPRPLSRM